MLSQISRRSLFLGSGAGATMLLAGCGPTAMKPLTTAGTMNLDNQLNIPPLAASSVDAEGTRVFSLTAETGKSSFLPETATETWGYNGAFLGPTLRARRGERVRVEIQNDLPAPTTVHWHGMHLPAIYDGGAHQIIETGARWEPEWVIDQPAATLWYHPHVHGTSEEQMTRGLSGMFIVDEPDTPAELPAEYGVDDIPLIFQDRSFAKDGSFKLTPDSTAGLLGDTILINGTANPYLEVVTEAVRLRILNAATARVFNFGFSDNRTFAVVGSDGGLLPATAEVQRLLLSPGERAEIVVRMRPGEEVLLRSHPQELGMGDALTTRTGGNDTLDLLKLRAETKLAPSPELPSTLAAESTFEMERPMITRGFILKDMYINGKLMGMSRIDLSVSAQSVETWNISNTDNLAHNFHVHGAQFQVLDIDGRAPAPEFAGWKDTVFLPVRATARVQIKFGKYKDRAHPYMYHCHFIRHADMGMMGQYTIV